MGYLHEGHFSLIKKARSENDVVIVSIFVNPAQFGPNEDLSRYPRNIERDLEMLKKLSVDIVFTPSVNEMYPTVFATYVDPTGPLVNVAEGASRPGHFRGVATVVLKLFQIIRPIQAYFGQKDAQQAAVIKRMVTDFNLPVTLHILPIIREADGLALSSRNSYLNPQDRKTAVILYKALQAGRKIFESHLKANPSLAIKAISGIIQTEPCVQLDYIQIRDPDTFTELKTLKAPALLLIAAKVGSVRLIDNFLLRRDGTWDTGIIKKN